jgi:hypothetical protein
MEVYNDGTDLIEEVHGKGSQADKLLKNLGSTDDITSISIASPRHIKTSPAMQDIRSTKTFGPENEEAKDAPEGVIDGTAKFKRVQRAHPFPTTSHVLPTEEANSWSYIQPLEDPAANAREVLAEALCLKSTY